MWREPQFSERELPSLRQTTFDFVVVGPVVNVFAVHRGVRHGQVAEHAQLAERQAFLAAGGQVFDAHRTLQVGDVAEIHALAVQF